MVLMSAATHLFVAALLTAPAVVVADDWSVTTADFRSTPAALRGLSADGVRVSPADGSGDRTVPLDQFVSAQRAVGSGATETPRYTLALAGGDRLVGEPTAMAGESLTWAEPLLGNVPVGLGRLVAIGRGATAPVPDERPKQDVVTLGNGDSVAGVLTGVGNGRLTVQPTDGNPTDILLTSVSRVAFANTGGGGITAARGFQVRLADGSAVTAAAVGVDGANVNLTLAGRGAKPIPLHLSDVVGIEQLNGPVGWLSSRSPTESVQVPYLGGGGSVAGTVRHGGRWVAASVRNPIVRPRHRRPRLQPDDLPDRCRLDGVPHAVRD